MIDPAVRAAIQRLSPADRAWLLRALTGQRGGYSAAPANSMGSLPGRFANLAGIHQQTHGATAYGGGYAMPYANNSPYTMRDEQGLNWHGHAGLPHGQPMGGYGLSRKVNPMAGPIQGHTPLTHPAFGGYGSGW